MTVEWVESRIGSIIHCGAKAGDYVLSVVGNGSGWMWDIRREDHVEFHGMEKSMAGAIRTAETVVQRVQGGSADA